MELNHLREFKGETWDLNLSLKWHQPDSYEQQTQPFPKTQPKEKSM